MSAVDASVVDRGQAVGAGPRARARRARRELAGSSWWLPYLFLAPYLLLFGLFVLAPVVLGLWISLHDWDPYLSSKPWVGLGNYADLFRPGSPFSENFWRSMRATAIFTLLSVPLLVTVPLLLALSLNRRIRGRSFFRAVFFAPYVLGVAVVGLI